MNILKTLSVGAVLAAGLAAAAPAAAITYVGSRDLGDGAVVELSVTTDDTLGVLGVANILDWTLHVAHGVESQDLFGPLSGDNSAVALFGSALSASATQLLYDFDGEGLLAFATEFGFAARGYCVDSAATTGFRCIDGVPGSEQVFFELSGPESLKVVRSGVGVLGTASNDAV